MLQHCKLIYWIQQFPDSNVNDLPRQLLSLETPVSRGPGCHAPDQSKAASFAGIAMGIEAEAPQEISGLIHWWHFVLTHRNSQEGSQRREIGVQDDRNCIIPQLDGAMQSQQKK